MSYIDEMIFFEPLTESIKVLEDNLSYYAGQANISIFPYALGNEEKEVEAVQDKQKEESSEEPKVEEKKEEAIAEEAENKTDEKS